MTGVRSLLAKFEEKNNGNDASPPSRGRSPAASDLSGFGRPLSKVRAGFVAIEKTGLPPGAPPQWGLKKASDLELTSDPSNPSRSDLTSPIERPRSAYSVSSMGTSMTRDYGKSATSSPPQQKSERKEPLGTMMKGSPFEEEEVESKTPKGTPRKNPVESNPVTPTKNNDASPSSFSRIEKAKEMLAVKISPPSGSSQANPTPPVKSTQANGEVSEDTKAAASVNIGQATVKEPEKATASAKSAVRKASKQTLAPSPSTQSLAPKRSAQNLTPKPSRQSLAAPKTPTTKPAPKSSATVTSHEKPKPKSPTKTTRLPSSATASTASSAAKFNHTPAHKGKPATASDVDHTQPTTKLTRKPSTIHSERDRTSGASVSSNLSRATAPTLSALQKQTPRASPSSQSNHHDRPRSRGSHHNVRVPDEAFLARMMRPTASSANKIHGKIEHKSQSHSQSHPKIAPKPSKANLKSKTRLKSQTPETSTASNTSPTPVAKSPSLPPPEETKYELDKNERQTVESVKESETTVEKPEKTALPENTANVPTEQAAANAVQKTAETRPEAEKTADEKEEAPETKHTKQNKAEPAQVEMPEAVQVTIGDHGERP